MADELTLTVRFKYVKDTTIIDEETVNLERDVAGTLIANTRQEIGVVEEPIDLSGVSTGGYMYVVNRDDTNSVEIRAETGGASLIKLLPGDVALFRLSPTITNDPQAIADNAPVEIEYAILSA